ncbi:MAG: LVIVD repeat-containing protein [Terriglobia bacterium]
MSARSFAVAMGLVCMLAGSSASVIKAEQPLERKNMVLIGHNDLNGHGDGGEGMAIQQRTDGRRILYIANVGVKTCLSIVDVTHPQDPVMINQFPSPGPGITRCNSLSLSGNELAVANETTKAGEKPAGMWVLDVSDLGRVEKAKRLRDLALSFFDTSGPHSRGVHWLWFVDGQFAHLSTGARDSNPTDPRDDQFYMAVDLRDPRHPREAGRWWLPGTQQGDACLPGCLPPRLPIDKVFGGYRVHSVEVFPQRPNRAYIGYIDGGQIILDISGLAEVRAGHAKSFSPKLVSRLRFYPPFPEFAHTVQPIFSRGLAVVTDESTEDECADAPQLVWLVDIRAETHPVIVGTAPLPENAGALCRRGSRFGPHNVQLNFPSSTAAQLKNTFVVAWFNGGVRVYRLIDTGYPQAPPRVEEIGYYVSPAPPGGKSPTIQMNDVIVDEHGLIYAIDRISGGLYIFKFTGSHPLN